MKEIKAVSVKIPIKLYDEIKAIGQQEVRSLSQEIVYLLQEHLTKNKKTNHER